MDTIFKGSLTTPSGRRNAWMDALFIDHAVLRILWTNFAVVRPGVLYRSNHPTPGNLRAFTRKHGIKTLINLRGQAKNGSDALSRESASQLGLDFHDMAMESRGAPHRERILRLADIFAGMRAPALIHCKSGADRAGLAAGIFLLLQGERASVALQQLSWRYGHIKQAKTGILDAFFLTYQRDGEARGKKFLDWVQEDYSENSLRAAYKVNALAGFINDHVLGRE